MFFFVSSQVARSSALVRTMALGKIVGPWFRRQKPLFRLSMALVEYINLSSGLEDLHMGLV